MLTSTAAGRAVAPERALGWSRQLRIKLTAFGVLFAVDLPLFMTLGPDATWTWTFVGVAAAMQAYPGPIGYALIARLGGAALLLQLATGGSSGAVPRAAGDHLLHRIHDARLWPLDRNRPAAAQYPDRAGRRPGGSCHPVGGDPACRSDST